MPTRRSAEEEPETDPTTTIGYDPKKHEEKQYGTGAILRYDLDPNRYRLEDLIEEQMEAKKKEGRFEARTWRFWKVGPILNQGGTPHCVGYSWRQFLSTAPKMRSDSNPTPVEIYQNAQRLDEYPGENYEGAGIVGGAKFLRQRNIFNNWYWTTDVGAMKTYVINFGCIEVSGDFYNDMVKLDNGGYGRPTGGIFGQHAYLISGWSARRGAFRCVNSWGQGWGRRGKFWIKFADMQTLMDPNRGRAITAVKI